MATDEPPIQQTFTALIAGISYNTYHPNTNMGVVSVLEVEFQLLDTTITVPIPRPDSETHVRFANALAEGREFTISINEVTNN